LRIDWRGVLVMIAASAGSAAIIGAAALLAAIRAMSIE